MAVMKTSAASTFSSLASVVASSSPQRLSVKQFQCIQLLSDILSVGGFHIALFHHGIMNLNFICDSLPSSEDQIEQIFDNEGGSECDNRSGNHKDWLWDADVFSVFPELVQQTGGRHADHHDCDDCQGLAE